MNEITTVGVDLAKEVIVVCAGDAEGRYAVTPECIQTSIAGSRLTELGNRISSLMANSFRLRG